MSVYLGTNLLAGTQDITGKANTSLNNLDSTGQAVIDGKVDLNLNNMNPSATAKETIVGWAMPDYNAGVSKSKNIIYQAECDGFVWIYGTQNNTNAAALVLKIGYQSDLSDLLDIGKFYSSPNSHLQSTCFIPIPKGMYYEGTDSQGGFTMTFYPAKGEINA